jgi:hypothetical protein
MTGYGTSLPTRRLATDQSRAEVSATSRGQAAYAWDTLNTAIAAIAQAIIKLTTSR